MSPQDISISLEVVKLARVKGTNQSLPNSFRKLTPLQINISREITQFSQQEALKKASEEQKNRITRARENNAQERQQQELRQESKIRKIF